MPLKAPESQRADEYYCNQRRLGTKEAYNFVNRGLGEACLQWLSRGREKGRSRIWKNLKPRGIAGLVSIEAWGPGASESLLPPSPLIAP